MDKKAEEGPANEDTPETGRALDLENSDEIYTISGTKVPQDLSRLLFLQIPRLYLETSASPTSALSAQNQSEVMRNRDEGSSPPKRTKVSADEPKKSSEPNDKKY